MTCTRCQQLPAVLRSKYGFCKYCTAEHNAAKVRERMAAKHKQNMLTKYGQAKAPKDWRKQARKPTADQSAGKNAAVRPPDKFIGNPRNCVVPVLVEDAARHEMLLERARVNRLCLPDRERI